MANIFYFTAVLVEIVQQYQSYIIYYWQNDKMLLLWNVLITIVLYSNKCLIGYVVIRGMGLDASPLQVVSILLLVVFLFYLVPTPGASFVAETSTSALMSVVVPAHLVAVFTLLWRFFTTYFGVLLGGTALFQEVSRVGYELKEKGEVMPSGRVQL